MLARNNSALDIVLLVCLVLLLGFSLVGEPGLTGRIPSMVFVLGGAMSILCGFKVEKIQRWHPALLASLVLLCWSALSSFFSLDRHLSEKSLTLLICGVGVFISTSYLSKNQPWIRNLKFVAVTYLLATVFKAFIMDLDVADSNSRLAGDFTNPNTLAVLLLIGVAMALSLQTNGNRYLEMFRIFASSVFVLSLFLTGSRSGFLGLVACLLTGLVAARKARRSKLKAYGLVGIGIATIIFVLASGVSGSLGSRTSALLTSQYDVPVRSELLFGSLSSGMQNPILGSGPGTYYLMLQTVRPLNTPTQELANSAHNDLLEYLVEVGVVGFVLWGFILFATLYFTPNQATTTRRSHWLSAGVAGVAIFALFNFVNPVPTTCLWFFFLLGLTVAESHRSTNLVVRPKVGFLITAVLIFLGSFAVLSTGCREVSTETLDRATAAADQGDFQQSLELVDRGLLYSAHNTDLWVLRSKVNYRLAIKESSDDHLRQSRKDLRTALRLSPNNREILFHLIGSYLRHGEVEQAIRYAEEAHRVAPYHDLTRARLASLYIVNDELQKAAKVLLLKPEAFPNSLAPILLELETQKPGEGLSLLSGLDSKSIIELVEKMRPAAVERKNKTLVLELHELAQELDREEGFSHKFHLAEDLLLLDERESALDILKSLVKIENRGKKKYSDVLVVWSTEVGQSSVPQLQGYLETDPGDTAVRIALSNVVDTTEAVELLNEGLKRMPRDAKMLHQMGVIFERKGLSEIAAGYFEDSRKSASLGKQ